mmetsp:Transcript_27243/g.41204  ORF Transcript_27243/g.41204 Transcript_27243/m.41204 type:complete len:326 (+) Transcript_27243:119-1096(+)
MKSFLLLSASILLCNGGVSSAFFSTPSYKYRYLSDENDFNIYSRLISKALFGKKNSHDPLGFGNSALLNRRNSLKAIGGIIIGSPVLLEIYARIGAVQTKVEESITGISGNESEITIIFHGAGGEDENTDALQRALSSKGSKGIVKMIDWSADSSDILQASVKGGKIGSQIGRLIVNKLDGSDDSTTKEKNIHVIGISVGAFAANSLVQTLNSQLDSSTRKKTYLQLTLLDPFQQKAVLGLNYGNRNFGKGSDFAQQYLNTDDPVPSTNAPLQYCSTVDVTSLRPDEIFGHDWPLVYYTQQIQQKKMVEIVPPEQLGKAGSLQVL